MRQDLGAVDLTPSQLDKSEIFVLLSSQKAIGCGIVDRIETAYRRQSDASVDVELTTLYFYFM